MGIGEILLLLAIVLLLFGASRLPAIGEGLGKSIKGFKDAMRSEPRPPAEKKGALPPGPDEPKA